MDEQSQQENLEEKLKDYVDCLTDKRYLWLLANFYTWGPVQPMTNGTKGTVTHMNPFSPPSAKTRQGALESLRLALASRLLPDFLLERSLTLADALEKCLKKGQVLGTWGTLARQVLTLAACANWKASCREG